MFRVSLEPTIWKRILLRLRLPHVPLRPSISYENPHTDFEFEQTVVRACSLDANWKSSRPKVLEYTELDLDRKVVDMVLLPGGKYLVASVRDCEGYRYTVEIYCIDHPEWSAIATLPTRAQAVQLRARYMKRGGEKGELIPSYLLVV